MSGHTPWQQMRLRTKTQTDAEHIRDLQDTVREQHDQFYSFKQASEERIRALTEENGRLRQSAEIAILQWDALVLKTERQMSWLQDKVLKQRKVIKEQEEKIDRNAWAAVKAKIHSLNRAKIKLEAEILELEIERNHLKAVVDAYRGDRDDSGIIGE